MEDIETLTRKSLAAMDIKRKALESEAEAITLELTAPTDGDGPPIGIDTPLVDSDGYPRADIDIYRARSQRGRLAQIRTDHKLLMKEIEETLYRLAAMKDPRKEEEVKEEMAARTAEKPKPKYDPVTKKWVVMNWDGSVAGIEQGEHLSFDEVGKEVNAAQLRNLNSTARSGRDTTPEFTTPFAKIDSVAAHSPAEQAGLKEGDLIVLFGDVNYTNHRQLQAIAELVPEAASEQRGILIKALRMQDPTEGAVAAQAVVSINLIPKPWNGRGLIGCHIVPYIG